MRNVEVLHPTRMRVEFALFDKDDLLHRGEILIGKDRVSSCFGNTQDLPTVANGKIVDATLFEGLEVEHEFGLPAATINLRYFQVRPVKSSPGAFEQFQRFEASLQMGVHLSQDWEKLVFDGFEFEFVFRSEPML